MLGIVEDVGGKGARERIESVEVEGGGTEYQAMRREEEIVRFWRGVLQSESVVEQVNLNPFENVDDARAQMLRDAGYETKDEIETTRDEDLLAIDGIGPETVASIREEAPYREPSVSELGLAKGTADALATAGYQTRADLQAATDYELLAVDTVGPATLTEIREVAPAPEESTGEESTGGEAASQATQ